MSRAGLLRAAALAALAVAVGPSGTAAAAQHAVGPDDAGSEAIPEGRVRSATLEADLGRAGTEVRVLTRWRLRVPEGREAVPLSGLSVRGTRISDVSVRVGDGPARPVTWTTGPESLAGGADAPVPGSLQGDSAVLEVSYRVESVGSTAGSRVRLPVIQVAWPPVEARPGTFVARLTLPDDAHVVGTFPTVLGEVEREEGGPRRYELDLQVVPGLLSVELREGEAPLLTFARALDAAVLVLLAGLGLWGFGALRRGAA